MLEKLTGDGMGVCFLCNVEKGFHREWITFLYHVRNSKQQLLRFYSDSRFSHTVFSDNPGCDPVCLCYKHALQVDESRKCGTDY